MANLYADAIFAENPTALWALDDDLAVASLSSLDGVVAFQDYGTPAYAYGSDKNFGYYIGTSSTTSTLKVRTSGIPMVYGASTVTNIDPNSLESPYQEFSKPSLVLPGFGFLNEDGKNKRLTLEAWIRISPSTQKNRRIIGAINGLSGLYVSGGFLSLQIGEVIGSHYVGEWGRPMLIHIYYTGTSAGVLLNGESVISINYDYRDIEFPTKLNTSDEDQDWIGFYSYPDISSFQVDCVSIYPYQVSVDKAKLHFVKGQSVESPEIKNSSYFDVPTVIDYQMSKYANNYTYPGTGRWRNGIVDNLSTDNNVLSAPNYQLPQLILEDNYRTISDWNILQAELDGQPDEFAIPSDGELIDNDVFFKIVPDNITDTSFNYAGYLYFDKLNLLQDPVKAVYGVFSVSSLPTSEELLFRISNSSNEYFEAVVSSNDIKHRFVSPATTTVEIVSADVVSVDTKFAVGIDIDALLSAEENNQLSKFFSNSSDLKVFLGGPPSFNGGTTISTSTPKLFGGRIYKFGFSNQNNVNKIKNIFTDGIANAGSATTFDSHIASYTLFGINTMGVFGLDIAVNGTWKDYVSLSQMDKSITTDSTGNTAYSLDFIQMNIDATEMSNVTNSPVRSYVEFSEIATSIISVNQITKTNVAAESDGVIEPDAEWLNKRYEFKNGDIVYLPTGGYSQYDDLGLATHLDFFIPGIIRNPLKIKMLQIASQALNYSGMKTPIGTRFGKDIYSFGTTSGNRDYSKKNPYSIYKGTTPYLYLTRQSGIKLLGSTFDGTRGIEIPINSNGKDYYKVSVLYASVMYEKPFSADVELFRIKHNTETIIIYADYTSPTTASAELKAKKLSDGSDLGSAVQFFVNGIENETTIRYGEWNMVGILFNGLIDFSGTAVDTRIDITGPFIVNNISDYQIDQAAEVSNLTFLPWSAMQSSKTWQQVLDATGGWREQLISAVGVVDIKLDASAIYNSYLGSSRVTATEDTYVLEVSQQAYRTYLGIRSSLISVSPL
jgi:hypothetical protein